MSDIFDKMDVDDGTGMPDLAKFYDKLMERAKKLGIMDAVNDSDIQQFKEYFILDKDPRELEGTTKPTIRFILFDSKEGGKLSPYYYPYHKSRSLRPLVGVFVPCYEKRKGKEKEDEKEVKSKEFYRLQAKMWQQIFFYFPELCKVDAKMK